MKTSRTTSLSSSIFSIKDFDNNYNNNINKKAIRVKFFRNGDKFYTGFDFAIPFYRFKHLGVLLQDLSKSVFCDQKKLPNGVRYIFTINGGKIKNLYELEDGGYYVCSSTPIFIKLNYLRDTLNPIWRTTNSKTRVNQTIKPLVVKDTNIIRTCSLLTNNSFQKGNNKKNSLYKKTIIIVKNDNIRPRKIFKWTFSLQPIPQFSFLIDELKIFLSVNNLFKLSTAEGSEILSVSDLLRVDTALIAFIEENMNQSDFVLSNQELTLINLLKESRAKPSRSDNISSNQCNMKFSNSSILNQNKFKTIKLINHHPDTLNSSIEWKEFTDKFEIGKIIGTGSFSCVKVCKEKKTGNLVALKRIDLKKSKDHLIKIKREEEILEKLNHPNVIKIINSFKTGEYSFIILEYLSNSDIINTILSSKYYCEHDISGMMHNLLSGIYYLHSKNIIHRDIKIENILVKNHKNGLKKLKICDFGMAIPIDPRKKLSTICGSPSHMAPEIILQTGYDGKVDLWSAGVVLYILLSGNFPFSDNEEDFNKIFENIINGKYDINSPFWEKVSPEAKNLLGAFLEQNPDKRLSAEEALNNNWIATENEISTINFRAIIGPKLLRNFSARSYYEKRGNNVLAKCCADKDSNYFEKVPSEEN